MSVSKTMSLPKEIVEQIESKGVQVGDVVRSLLIQWYNSGADLNSLGGQSILISNNKK